MRKITPTQITLPLVRFAESPANRNAKSVRTPRRPSTNRSPVAAVTRSRSTVRLPPASSDLLFTQKMALNQHPGVLRVQDPGRDRAQTAAATQVWRAGVVSRYA